MTTTPETDDVAAQLAYDAGLLNDYGGGDVPWWQDYIRAELDRSHDFYAATIAALTARVAELEGALQPFADEAKRRDRLAPGPDIDHWPIGGSALTYGDLRIARQALAGEAG